MSSFGPKHNVNAWFMYVLVTNLWGSDLHLNPTCLRPISVAKLCSSSNKASNSPAGTFELRPQVGLKSRERGHKNDAKTRPERGQKIALETPQLCSSLPPAQQQVSSRSLEAVWQQLSSSLHAAHGDAQQPFSSSPASAQQQPSSRPAAILQQPI